MNTIKVMPNQSMADVILQGCGTMEGSMQMMLANNMSISDYPDVGSVLKVGNDSNTANTSAEVLQYLGQNGIIIGTLNNDVVVTVAEVLKPIMQVAPRTSTPPSVTGDYEFDYEAAPGFINVYPIPHAYYPGIPTPPFYYITEERYIAGDAPEGNLGVDLGGTGIPFMDAKLVSYRLLWVTGRGFMLAWSDMGPGIKTLTFEDVRGNQAYAAPLIVLDNTTQIVEEYLIAALLVEVVSVTHNTATLRLTRSQPPVAHMDFLVHTMSWLNDAAGGTADPLDPGNPDKTILVLPRGTYTFGVGTLYHNGSTTYPASAVTEVVEIT
jgi:hypothetical protein